MIIVHAELVKEKSLLYSNRKVRSPQEGAALFREFLGEVDREHFLIKLHRSVNVTIVRNHFVEFLNRRVPAI